MKTDILVIGGGLAGLRAAQAAAASCEVTVIADGAGASPFIHGVNIPVHRDDSVELFIGDTLKSGKGQGREALVRELCESSLPLVREFPFTKNGDGYELLKPLGSSLPRVAGIDGRTGARILHDIRAAGGFREYQGLRALRLHTENGRVTGAFCFDTLRREWLFIAAKAVILATGGFGGIFPFSTNSSDIGGDGIAMALEAGAELCDMEFIQFEPTAAVWPESLKGKSIITTMLYEGAVIRNGRGERFMDERVNKDELSLGIYEEIRRGNAAEHGGVYYDMTAVDPALLLGKYKDYTKRYADAGIDIRKEWAEIAPAPHTTLGGIVIDSSCGTSVEGLFACGEVSGGLHGANRLGGNAGLEVLVFGKRAGESAARYASAMAAVPAEQPVPVSAPQDGLPVLRRALSDGVLHALNVIRNETELQALRSLAEDIRTRCGAQLFCYESSRLFNDALTVLASAVCALERKASIGCHVRSDSQAESGKYRLLVRKAGQELLLRKEIIDNAE